MASTGLNSLSTELVLMVMLELSSRKDVYSVIRASVPFHQTFLAHKAKFLSTVIQQATPPEVPLHIIAPTGLNSLSAELVLMVMVHLSSPRDVYSMIRASLLFHQIFLTYKSKILSSVIQQAIPPEVLPDALAACDASRIESLTSHCSKLDRSTRTSIRENRKLHVSMRQQAMEFLRNYRRRTQQRVDDLSTTLRLCRLWTITECFVTRYSEQAFKNTRRHLSRQRSRNPGDCAEGQSPTGALSKAEHSRLQRAFFRFEIFRKIFTPGIEDRHRYSPIMNKREQSLLLQVLLRPWELEELACVHEYLVKEMEYSFDELEGIFVENIMKAAKDGEELLLSSGPVDSGYALYTKYTGLGILDWHGLGMFEGTCGVSCHDEEIKSMVARGLPFLRRYLRLGSKERMAVMTFYSMGDSSLEEVLDGATYYPDNQRATAKPTESSDSLRNSTMIWSWARQSKSQVSYRFCAPEETALRSLGYIFWDKIRLQAAGILDHPRDELELILDHRDREDMMTAGERLEGLRIPHSALEDQKSDLNPREILGDYEY